MTPTIWIANAVYLEKASDGLISYAKLKHVLQECTGDAIAESFYLNAVSETNVATHTEFYNWLKTSPPQGPHMRVQLYPNKQPIVVCPVCDHKIVQQVCTDIDVGIATLIVKLAAQWRYDRLVLSTGDGAFQAALEYIKDELHKELWLAGFQGTISPDLQMYADHVIWLDQFWERIT